MSGVQAAMFGGSAMILLTLLLRKLFGRRLPKRLFPALWCAAAGRLLVPIAIPSKLSIWNLLHRVPGASTAGMISDAPLPFPSLLQTAEKSAAPAANSAQSSPLLLIWLSCSVLLGAYFGIGYVCMVRRFRGAKRMPQPSAAPLLDLFHFSRAPRICVSESRRAPLTFGIFRPTVVMPEDLPVEDARFRLVLAHELAHVRRKDCLRKLLFTVCLCLYWQNPLVWLMVWLANRDMELACDEKVLCTLGPECKKAYAMTLLDMAQRKPAQEPLCSGFAKSGAEDRIRAILSFKRIPAWVGSCVFLAFVLAAGVFATQAVTPSAAPRPEPSIEERAPEEAVAATVEKTIPEAPSSLPESEMQPEAPAYVWPLEDADAEVTDGFGLREHPLSQTAAFHSGVDLAAEAGEHVLAVADGTVVSCEYNEAYGYLLTLSHADGVQTQYAHLQEFLVQPGDTVVQGQIVALVGSSGWSTGAHLHLNVLLAGEPADPLEALAFGV